MAGDAILIMKGLTKLSKAIVETQAGQLRQVFLGGDAVTIAKTLQATAEEQFSSALGKMQVSKALCAQSSLMFCFLVLLWGWLGPCIVNKSLVLKCWINNKGVATLWEFSRISVVCSRCLDRNGKGMLLQSVCFHYRVFKRCWKWKALCSPHLVKDQTLAKVGQQLHYLKSPLKFSHWFSLLWLWMSSSRVSWIYLSAASFLGRIGAEWFRCSSLTAQTGFFRADFSNKEPKSKMFFKQQVLSPDMGMDL